MRKFLDDIVSFSSANVFNPWRHTDPLDAHMFASDHRLSRLVQHFDCDPRYLLIGEAPGYQGCHFSGVPFTNESLLINGAVPRVPVTARITTRKLPWCEPSATIVWKELHRLDIAEHTIMWNAFAWHPFKPGDPLSNRAPTKAELKAGEHVLRSVLDHFRHAKIIAVGRVAEAALQRLGIDQVTAIRHPSMGGASQFRSQLQQITTGNAS